MSDEVDAEIEALIAVVKILARTFSDEERHENVEVSFADAPARGKAATDTTSAPSVLTNERPYWRSTRRKLTMPWGSTRSARNGSRTQSRRAHDPVARRCGWITSTRQPRLTAFDDKIWPTFALKAISSYGAFDEPR